MLFIRTFLLAAILSAGALVTNAAHTRARLIFANETATPAQTIWAGVHLQMDNHWHTYWRNSGEAGIPTKIDWHLPDGIRAGDIQWPVPKKDMFGGLTTFGYEKEVVLLVPLTLASNLPSGEIKIAATVSWLECETEGLCIPGNQNVEARIKIAGTAASSNEAPLIERWKKQLPKNGDSLAAAAMWERPAEGDSRPLILTWKTAAQPQRADFFPYESSDFEIAPATEFLPGNDGTSQLRIKISRLTAWPTNLSGLLVQNAGDASEAYEITTAIPDTAASASGTKTVSAPPANLWKMLGFAFLGGLILNIMPCVFPVIALKILGFVKQSEHEPRRVFRLGLVYSAGVLVSFLVLAGIVIGVQQAGGAANWGMQLQSAPFSVALTVLVTLVALNLFGVFEVNLGGGALNAAGQLTSRHGASGAFFNGVLATILATPCTAPFLAPALGFAFVQTPPIIVLFFVAIAAGLAAPYILLSWHPGWLKFLPRPGAWMEKFKIAMGFPMLATAVWLFWFTAPRFGPTGVLWLGLFLVVAALALWVWGDFVQRSRARRAFAMFISVVLLALGYFYILEGELHWRHPVKRTASPQNASPNAIAWQPWSPQAVEQARAQRRPVLVDFTADWCLTCQANKRVAIEVPEVNAKLKELNAVALIGDNTENDPTIVAELRKFDRAGVPLVLVFPADASKPPEVLPTLLTKGIILDALERARK